MESSWRGFRLAVLVLVALVFGSVARLVDAYDIALLNIPEQLDGPTSVREVPRRSEQGSWAHFLLLDRKGKEIIVQEEVLLEEAYVVHQVYSGEVLSSIAVRYGTTVDVLMTHNDLENPDRLQVGQELLIPASVVSGQSNTGYIWPLTINGPISSPFGPRWGSLHTGIDIAVPVGTEVLASRSGEVIFAGTLGAYGRVVIIRHGRQEETVYAHLSTISVNKGQWVDAGQLIGKVGLTGRTTGPHLHFEVRVLGKPVNPVHYLEVTGR